MNSAIAMAACLGLGTTLVLTPLSLRFQWCAMWNRRPIDWHHSHAGPVPRVGGAILVSAFILVELWIAILHPELRARTPGRDLIVAASVAMFALGFWDDLRPLGPSKKLLGQVLISALVCAGGTRIEVWRTPFSQAPVHLAAWGPVLTVAWLVGLTNLINLVDGIDGLAGGICLMLMGLIAAVAYPDGNFELLACGMAGALLGFLWYNFPPARIYLGDGGAYFLGFQIGLYALVNSHKGAVFAALAAPLFVLALPITDAALTVARRGLRGLPLFRPDRKHLHHRLVANGGASRKLLLTVYAFNLVFLSMGLAAFWSRGRWMPALVGLALLFLFGCAGSLSFSRGWFAVHRVVGSCWRMRDQVQYALCLAHWLELEARRKTGPEEFWPDLVFAANKLGFASVKLHLPQGARAWQSPGLAGTVRRYQFEGHHYDLELNAPTCPVGYRQPRANCPGAGSCQERSGCVADPRLFETLSELLAEAWNHAANHWQSRGTPSGAQPGGRLSSRPIQSVEPLAAPRRTVETAAPGNHHREPEKPERILL